MYFLVVMQDRSGPEGPPGLPDYMVPDHNTEQWEGDDEEDDGDDDADEALDATAAASDHLVVADDVRGSGTMALVPGHSWLQQQRQRQQQQRQHVVRGVKLPLRLNALVVESLGEVNFMHPKFHDEKQIWPVGYVAKRLARTPASGLREVSHKVEVLEAKDGSGPLFR